MCIRDSRRSSRRRTPGTTSGKLKQVRSGRAGGAGCANTGGERGDGWRSRSSRWPQPEPAGAPRRPSRAVSPTTSSRGPAGSCRPRTRRARASSRTSTTRPAPARRIATARRSAADGCRRGATPRHNARPRPPLLAQPAPAEGACSGRRRVVALPAPAEGGYVFALVVADDDIHPRRHALGSPADCQGQERQQLERPPLGLLQQIEALGRVGLAPRGAEERVGPGGAEPAVAGVADEALEEIRRVAGAARPREVQQGRTALPYD